MNLKTRQWLSTALVLAAGLAAFHVSAKPAIEGPWTSHENLAPVTVDGKTYTATCSGYPGTDPAFRFWSKKGSSKNLVVFFEGGGACWDDLSCSLPSNFYTSAVPADADPATYSGIFDQSNPTNPVKDWSIVYIPYCTGDIHTGSTTQTYHNFFNPAQTFPIQHRGFDNFMVVLDWIRKNFDAPKSILITGSSAGGYGAALNFPYVAETYPNAHMHVIADAAQGVTTPAFDLNYPGPGRNSWNMQLPPWIFGPSPVPTPSADLLKLSAAYYPHAKISQFTTPVDLVQIQFYGVMKQFYGPGGACPSAVVDWNNQMLGTLASYSNDVKNFRYYMADGTYHTIMRSPLFYTESSAGVKYSDWVGKMLQNRGGTNGKGGGWFNAACPTCLMPIPCQ